MFARSLLSAAVLLVALLSSSTTKADFTKKKGLVKTVEKGHKCEAGADMKKGEGHEDCEGGMKMSFEASCGPKEMAEIVAQGLSGQVRDSLFGGDAHVDDMFLPNDNVLQEWIESEENVNVASEELDMSKTIEFGGTANVDFGCKITYAYKHGTYSKQVECGFKLKKHGGWKKKDDDKDGPDDDDDDENEEISETMLRANTL